MQNSQIFLPTKRDNRQSICRSQINTHNNAMSMRDHEMQPLRESRLHLKQNSFSTEGKPGYSKWNSSGDHISTGICRYSRFENSARPCCESSCDGTSDCSSGDGSGEQSGNGVEGGRPSGADTIIPTLQQYKQHYCSSDLNFRQRDERSRCLTIF